MEMNPLLLFGIAGHECDIGTGVAGTWFMRNSRFSTNSHKTLGDDLDINRPGTPGAVADVQQLLYAPVQLPFSRCCGGQAS